MPLVINTNISSITAQRHLDSARNDMQKSMERLSSGLRINSAMDDAAGLTIAHSLDSEIASLSQAVRNANDGISLVNLAEGAMDEISAMLTRMKELATQGMNGTYSDADRANLNIEFQALSAEITRITENTFFNGIHVLNSSATTTFQVGDGATDFIAIDYQPMGSAFIGGTVTNNHEVAAITSTDVNNITSYIYDTLDTGETAVPVAGEQLQITVNGRTFVQDFTTDVDTTMNALASQVTNASIKNVASVTWEEASRQRVAATTSTDANNITSYTYATLDTGEPARPLPGEQLQITVNGRTFVQDFTTDVDTTMNALASQVTNASINNVASVTWDASNDTNLVIKSVANATLTVSDVTINDTYLFIKSVANETLTVSDVSIYTKATSGNITSQEISDVASAGRTLSHIESAIEDVDMYRATLGAQANRIQHAASNLMSRVEHQAAARSRIQDADYAVESANLAKAQILQQAGTAMLAQSNASMQNVLELLK